MAHTFRQKSQANAQTANPTTHNHTPGAAATVAILGMVVFGTTARTGGSPTIDGTTATKLSASPLVGSESQVEIWYVCKAFSGSQFAVSIPNANTRTIHLEVVTADAGTGFTSAFQDEGSGNWGSGSSGGSTSGATSDASGDFYYCRLHCGEAAVGSVTESSSSPTKTLTYANDHGQYTSFGYYANADAAEAMFCTFGWTSDVGVALDVIFKSVASSTTYTKTLSLDSYLVKVFTKTISLDALLQKLNQTKTISLDSYLKQVFTKTPVIDGLLSKAQSKTVSIDSLLSKMDLTKTVSLDAFLQSIVDSSFVSLDALLIKALIKETSIDGVLQKLDLTRTASVDSLLQKLGQTKTVSLDAILYAAVTYTLGVSLDSYLQKEEIKTVSLDSLLSTIYSKLVSLDSYLQKEFIKTVSMDSVLNKGYSVSTSLDGLLSIVYSKVVSIDGYLQKEFTKTVSMDSLLRKSLSASISLDAILYTVGIETITTYLDSLLTKSQIATLVLDAYLSTVGSNTVSLDALLQRANVSHTLNLDAILISGAEPEPTIRGLLSIPNIPTRRVDRWLSRH